MVDGVPAIPAQHGPDRIRGSGRRHENGRDPGGGSAVAAEPAADPSLTARDRVDPGPGHRRGVEGAIACSQPEDARRIPASAPAASPTAVAASDGRDVGGVDESGSLDSEDPDSRSFPASPARCGARDAGRRAVPSETAADVRGLAADDVRIPGGPDQQPEPLTASASNAVRPDAVAAVTAHPAAKGVEVVPIQGGATGDRGHGDLDRIASRAARPAPGGPAPPPPAPAPPAPPRPPPPVAFSRPSPPRPPVTFSMRLFRIVADGAASTRIPTATFPSPPAAPGERPRAPRKPVIPFIAFARIVGSAPERTRIPAASCVTGGPVMFVKTLFVKTG